MSPERSKYMMRYCTRCLKTTGWRRRGDVWTCVDCGKSMRAVEPAMH